MVAARRSAILNVMAETAEKAGRALVRDFGEVEHLQVSRKGPGDFVSAADHKSEKMIKAALEKARAGYSLLMEESGETKGMDKSHKWIVDPLDGTTNFLHGIPHWCVTIALEKDGEIMAGVIYDPVKDEMFTAEKGTGAFVNNRRLRVSARTSMADALVSIPPGAAATLDPSVRNRNLGSAALNLAYVAAGRFDAYVEAKINPWDCAAGGLMVREAGGYATDFKGGKDYVYNKGIVAATPALHTELLKRLNAAEKNVKSAS